MGRDSFLLPKAKLKTIELMSDEEAGSLFKALYRYATTGDVEKASFSGDRFLKCSFDELRDYIDANEAKYAERCASNRENGKRGGRPSSAE